MAGAESELRACGFACYRWVSLDKRLRFVRESADQPADALREGAAHRANRDETHERR
jgi:hypothetical protein